LLQPEDGDRVGIPVIRQITRLTDPYFVTNDRLDVEISGLGTRYVTERRFASLLIVALVLINQLQVGINVCLSFFNRDWFNAIQNKDLATFWSLLFGVFCFWAAIAVVSSLIEYYTESVLKIRWRRWMSERYYGLWLDDGRLYRAALVGHAADNPDQRIAEDVHNFLNSTYAYSISMFRWHRVYCDRHKEFILIGPVIASLHTVVISCCWAHPARRTRPIIARYFIRALST
jgi:putative ATP-binding cassette transporter